MDTNSLLSKTPYFNHASADGTSPSIENNDASISTKNGKAWTRTVSVNDSNKEESSIGDKPKLSNLSSYTNNVTKKETATIKSCDRSKSEFNRSTKQLSCVTKKSDDTTANYNDPKEAYIKCKAEFNKLTAQIKDIRKKANAITTYCSTKDKGNTINKTKLDELIKELSSVAKCMESHKKKLRSRKAEGSICNKVRSFINRAAESHQKSRPRNKSLRARLTSICTSIKKCLNHKGLVKILKIAAVALVALVVFSAANALFGGVLFGFLSIALVLGLCFVFPASGLSKVRSILAAVNYSESTNHRLHDRDEDEIQSLMEEINSLAQCLTTDSSPDVSTLLQLILEMEDNSFLSGDSDYDEIYNNLITYLQTHENVHENLMDKASLRDYQILEDMLTNVNNNNLSLPQINEQPAEIKIC